MESLSPHPPQAGGNVRGSSCLRKLKFRIEPLGPGPNVEDGQHAIRDEPAARRIQVSISKLPLVMDINRCGMIRSRASLARVIATYNRRRSSSISSSVRVPCQTEYSRQPRQDADDPPFLTFAEWIVDKIV